MSLPSSPGKMDLSALGGLKKRALQPVPPAPVEAVPDEQVPETSPVAAPETPPASEVPDNPAAASAAVEETDTVEETETDTAADASPVQPVERPSPPDRVPTAIAPVSTPAKIEHVEEEHSGHVTLYLPKGLNQWLGEHRASTGISYPGIVLNAISWAAAENRFAEIFAPADSPIPANDIFGRAPVIPRPARGSVEPETRPLRFRKDHMRVIISLARTWTADNRNAFFVGVLTAYRDQQNKE
ncbi:hypothetical protein SAMN04489742_0128 [Arthrobacter crystallopoietes]|uniref:Uncharacterized protein n=1 Tax=Crystallibacter crystallopoietes TaxID=37928 RepID=A0A1H0XLW1_9MICC|nr:hypothetical protein SAMN04489742_0128 [Arthrobacter crystallopoietes]